MRIPQNVLSPRPVVKRRSLQEKLTPLTEDQEECIKLHLNLIEKSKAKVVEAKAARFKGFFSPRLLRQKAHKFTISRINRVLRRDFDDKSDAKEYLRSFLPQSKVDYITEKTCTIKQKKIENRNAERDNRADRFFSPQPIGRSKSDELPEVLFKF